jgi:outer membrane protein assembly factor BamB
MRCPFLATLLSLVLTGALQAGDWPQWRGPGRDGRAPDAQLPTTWPADPPKPLWKVAVGEGYSSPVIADGRLFIMGRVGDEKEVCYGFDASNGNLLWKHDYDAPYKPPDLTAGRGPKSTPLVDGDRVYMLGLGGMFHCFEARTGRIVWKRDFAKEYWGVEKDKDGDDAWWPACGAACSALVDGTHLVMPVGGKKAGAFTAFDKKTGDILWTSLPDRSSYGSPLLVPLAGSRQLVGFTGLRMVGLDPAGGQLLWEYPFPCKFEQTVLTPVIWKDLVVFGGEAKPTVALRIEKKGQQVTQTVAWTSKDLRAYLTSPVAFKDHLVGLSHFRKQLVCLDLAGGKTKWTEDDFGDYASLVVAGEQLLVLNGDGELHVLEANPDKFVRRARWQVSDEGPTWSHLAVVGNRLYIKDKQHLFCLDVAGR